MSNVFLGEPSEYIRNWFVETFISEDDYTILTINNGSTKKLYINGAATWQNIGVQSSQGSYDNTLKSCQLGKKVTEISGYAFINCFSLTSIDIPDSVSSIGQWTFNRCSSLTSINIPNSVTSIGNGTFLHCSSLTSVNIPSSVTSIGNDTFQYCNSLPSINIPRSVTSIGSNAFSHCNSLTSITFNSIIKTLGFGALSGNVNLLSVIGPLFPSKGLRVNNIEDGVFKNCKSLKQIYIDLDYISSIGYDTFGGCSSLTSIFFVTGQGATLAKISSMANYPFGADPSIIKLVIGEPT